MTGSRTNTQKLLTLHVDESLFAATERARGRINRSQWIRDAIAEKCAREGIPVPADAVYAPDRGRKSGQKWSPETQRKTTSSPPSPMLNDNNVGSEAAKAKQVPIKYPKPKAQPKKKTK